MSRIYHPNRRRIPQKMASSVYKWLLKQKIFHHEEEFPEVEMKMDNVPGNPVVKKKQGVLDLLLSELGKVHIGDFTFDHSDAVKELVMVYHDLEKRGLDVRAKKTQERIMATALEENGMWLTCEESDRPHRIFPNGVKIILNNGVHWGWRYASWKKFDGPIPDEVLSELLAGNDESIVIGHSGGHSSDNIYLALKEIGTGYYSIALYQWGNEKNLKQGE